MRKGYDTVALCEDVCGNACCSADKKSNIFVFERFCFNVCGKCGGGEFFSVFVKSDDETFGEGELINFFVGKFCVLGEAILEFLHTVFDILVADFSYAEKGDHAMWCDCGV